MTLIPILMTTGMLIRGSNPGGGEIFRSCPDWPWGPPSLLYNGYWVSFPGVKRPGRGVDHPPLSSVRVKERVELYLYSPSGPLWPVLWRTLTFMCLRVTNQMATACQGYHTNNFTTSVWGQARHTLIIRQVEVKPYFLYYLILNNIF
jgi:hypothetical protein